MSATLIIVRVNDLFTKDIVIKELGYLSQIITVHDIDCDLYVCIALFFNEYPYTRSIPFFGLGMYSSSHNN